MSAADMAASGEAGVAERPHPRGAPFGRRRAPVSHNRAVGSYALVTVLDPDPVGPQPGQFYMLSAATGWGTEDGRPYLPRALSVARASASAPGIALEFLLEEVGPGTRRLLALAPGEDVWLTGPLGRGFTAPPEGFAPLLVGGGAGVAPLIGWQERLRSSDRKAPALLGFRDAEHAQAAALLADARVSTDDGSIGERGLVTELLADALGKAGDPREAGAAGAPAVYACGPPAMLEAVRVLVTEVGVPAQLALEAPMACGHGGCYGCVVPTHEGYVRTCVEGPVIDAARLSAVRPGQP